MIRRVLALSLISVAITAHAGVFKCTGTDGKTQFSDTPCKSGTKAEAVPDRVPITAQQQLEAQQRAARLQAESASAETPPAAPATRAAQNSSPASSAQSAPNDADAIAHCVRDIERQAASQKTKAEMIVACQSAGRKQRETAASTDSVSDCVRSVERTGASGTDKARFLAQCHGGNVEPEQHHRPRR